MIFRSAAVVVRSGSGQPVEFRKFVFFMPIFLAQKFISSAKAFSVPEIPSARTMAASLPDWTIMPCRSSRTDTVLPTSRNVRDPPFFQAFSEMVNLSSIPSWPSAIRWNATKTVMIFAIDAGFIGASESLLNRTLPVAKSVI